MIVCVRAVRLHEIRFIGISDPIFPVNRSKLTVTKLTNSFDEIK